MTATAAKTSVLKWIPVFFQSLSRLFQFAENGKCRRISLELISWGLHSSLEREKEIRCRLFTFSIKLAIRHFLTSQPCKDGKEMYKTAWCTLLFCQSKPIACLKSSLPSASSLLKLPNAHNLSLPLQPLHRPTPPPSPPPKKPFLERNLGPRKKIQDGAWKLPTFSERDELYSDFNVCIELHRHGLNG